MTNVFDLDDIVEKWAAEVEGAANGSKQNFTYKLDWSKVNVTTGKPTYSVTRPTSPQSVILFKSRFDNNSSEQQEHSFSAQSKYTALSSVSLHQCFSLDGRTQLDLSLPGDVLKATSGFGQKFSVTSSARQTIEKEQQWNVNTKIIVPGEASRTALQSISETKYSAPFSVETVISGKVHVNKLDRNGSFVKSVGPKCIVEIIKFAFAGLMPDYLKIDGSTMRITSSGQCEFTYAVEQQVTVSSN